jgi:hypothetical protein
MLTLQRIAVFCGSSTGARPEYRDAARSLGATLARRKIGVVYGGGSIGLMGVLADAALAGGGEVIGVIPQAMVDEELAHDGLSELRVVHSMHERKATMEELSSAFIAMPGGFGTFDELFEIVTWLQLGLHRKPVGLLDAAGYFDPLLEMIRTAVREGFVKEVHARALHTSADPEALLDALASSELPPPKLKKIDLEET